MKYDMPCSVAQRLMANDNINNSLKARLAEHISDCSECRREYENMKNTDFVDNRTEKNLLKKAKRKINKKIMCVAAVVAVVAASLTGMGMARYTMSNVPYDKVNVDVREIAFDDIDWLPAPKGSDGYVASIKLDGDLFSVTQADYDAAKKNEKVQYIHLTSKYDTDSFSQGIYRVDGSNVCVISIDTDNNKGKDPTGPKWIQYDRMIDKIVYCQRDKSLFEAFRTGDDDLIDERADSYHIIWQSDASRSFSEPKLLFKDDEKFGRANAQAEIKYWKSYDEGELRYAFFISAACDENYSITDVTSWSGAFCDLDDAMNGSVSYDDLAYIAASSNDERYYWEIVPSDCSYALVDGEKLYAKTATIDLEGEQFTVRYIAGAVKNKSGKKGYTQYIVTLYDESGNAHTAK